MEYKENRKLFKLNMDKINKSELYRLVLNHFFVSKDNVYLESNNKIIGLITYDSCVNDTTNFNSMVIKDYPIIDESDTEVSIKETFKKYENYDSLPVFAKSTLLYELVRPIQYKKIPIDIERWKYLYKNNEKIADALKKYEFDSICVIGELFDEVYNYIIINTNYHCIKMANNREDFIKHVNNEKALIIDTNYCCSDFRKKIYKYEFYKTYGVCAKYVNLVELCELSELLSFKDFYNNKSFNTLIFEFQVPEELHNLSFSEQLRIKFDKHYRYYYDHLDNPEISSIVKKVLGKNFNKDFILSRDEMPGTILKNGLCYLTESTNQYCKAVNGLRFTAYKKNKYYSKINIFGACIVYGAVVDDENTIPSLIQKKLNDDNFEYEVFNYGARAIDFYENFRIANSLKIKENEVFIFVVSPDERKQLESIGISDVHKFADVLNERSDIRDYFMGEPVHCNAEANSIIAEYMYAYLCKLLKDSSYIKNSNVVKQISKNDKNGEHISLELKKYLNYLNGIDRKTSINGAVMINGNPFTKGHYHLIEYASKMVDTLYVFIVREDKSYFKYQDRLKMAISNCKDFNNVVVTGSGTVFGTAMTFPSYYERDSEQEVRLDASLDVELFAEYIAPTLNITKRFVGDEPNDVITNQYNMLLRDRLVDYGIDLTIIPRHKIDNLVVSAKTVRKAIENNDIDMIKKLVPEGTYVIIKDKYMKHEGVVKND